MPLIVLIAQEIPRVLEALCQEQGQIQIYIYMYLYFFYKSQHHTLLPQYVSLNIYL